MPRKEQNTTPPETSEEEIRGIIEILLSDRVAELSPDHRRQFAQKFIDFFTNREINEELLSIAQISPDNMKEPIIEDHTPERELLFRVNYAALLLRLPEQEELPFYTDLITVMNLSEAYYDDLAREWSAKGTYPKSDEVLMKVHSPFWLREQTIIQVDKDYKNLHSSLNSQRGLPETTSKTVVAVARFKSASFAPTQLAPAA